MNDTLTALRKAGWRVAAHNDYKLKGHWYTFWLFARGNEYVKGEGGTDAEAFSEIHSKLDICWNLKSTNRKAE